MNKWMQIEDKLFAKAAEFGKSGVPVTCAIIVALRLGRKANYVQLEAAMLAALGVATTVVIS